MRPHRYHVMFPLWQAPPTHAAHDAQIAGQGAKRLCAEVRKIARTNSAHRPPAPICEYRAVARVGLEQSQDLIARTVAEDWHYRRSALGPSQVISTYLCVRSH